jgi:hypothetical protein
MFDVSMPKLISLLFEIAQSRLHGWLIHAILNRRENSCDRAFDLVQTAPVQFRLSTLLPVSVIDLLNVAGHGLLHRVRRNEALRYAMQRTLLQQLTPDGPIVAAGTLSEVVVAAVSIIHDDGAVPAANAAFYHSRKQEYGSMQVAKSLSL